MHFLLSGRNKRTVAVIAIWICLHLFLLRLWPSFAIGPRRHPPSGVGIAFLLEALGQVIVLGVAVTAIRNRISWWKNPTYSDDGLLSIAAFEERREIRYEVTTSQRQEVFMIIGELCLYGVVWLVILTHSWSS